jgi:hypothetical protein
MPQEVIDRVNQLFIADRQPELLTFYDRKGRLIGESETPGVPYTPETIIPEDDELGDLNPPTVNYNDGPKEELNIDQPTVEPLQAPDPAVPPVGGPKNGSSKPG